MNCGKGALAQGFVRCHDCGLVIRLTPSRRFCGRCGGVLSRRQPRSLQRTLAFLLSGYVLYVPANIFPIMTVSQLGQGEPHTIIGGILALIKSGMMPIALLVLVASILVPLLKLLGLTFLLLCLRYRWRINAQHWTVIYRIIAFVGRWSMLDIFMISILVGLVDLGGVAQIIAGSAATAFAAVVVLTMLAAKYFDPRLLWDLSSSHD